MTLLARRIGNDVSYVLDPVVVVRYVRVRSGGFSSKDFCFKIFFKDFF